jgi:hypothetical protein
MVAPLFERLHLDKCDRDKAAKRELHYDKLCMLVLLDMFNPTVILLRSITQATELREQAESIHGNQNLLGINQTIALADGSLVACLPISIWTVRKPTKRTFEMINYYFMGQASTEELVAHVARLSKHDELTISDS